MKRLVPSRARGLRTVALVAHRYVGLVLATFLLVAGLTGSLIAFQEPLDALLNPALLRAVPERPDAPLLDPIALRERLRSQLPPDTDLDFVVLQRDPGKTVNYWLDGREYFVDPYTGKLAGSRTWGDLGEGMINIVPFIYRLHSSLALAEVGEVIFGVVALLWTVDCFVGAYLTFPQPRQRRAGGGHKSWWSRWLPSWSIKAAKMFTLVFTWHRASGLWAWMLLLVFAWSGVALTLGDAVYQPVMNAVFGPDVHAVSALAVRTTPAAQPALSLREALAVGREAMTSEALRRGFRVLGERSLAYHPEHGVYVYSVESSLDVSERLADTSLTFDADAGRVLRFAAPTGRHLGSTTSSWLIGLHFGAIREGGLPYRAFVSLMGMVVALLSVSGVLIWGKKRAARVVNAPARAAIPVARDTRAAGYRAGDRIRPVRARATDRVR